VLPDTIREGEKPGKEAEMAVIQTPNILSEDEQYNRKYAVEALALYEQRQGEGYTPRDVALARAERFYSQGWRVDALGNLTKVG
jgi:hypothetical protein